MDEIASEYDCTAIISTDATLYTDDDPFRGYWSDEYGAPCDHHDGDPECKCQRHVFDCLCGACELSQEAEERAECESRQEAIAQWEARRWTCPGATCEGCQSCPDDSPVFGANVLRGDDAIDKYLLDLEREIDRKDNADRLAVLEGAFGSYVATLDAGDNPDERLPALVKRTDGETILYAGAFVSVFGEPGLGKSWAVQMMALDAMRDVGSSVIWLDYEATARTLARRAHTLGALPIFQSPAFKYVNPAIMDDVEVFGNLIQWSALQERCVVVIDSAEAAGCPSDGKPVMPWITAHVRPWQGAGCTVIVIDHVAKAKENRPRGAIGSQRKLADADLSLYVTGVPWTKTTDGRLKIVNHKDRHGELPVGVNKTAAVLTGKWLGGAFTYSWDVPNAEDEDGNGAQMEEATAIIDNLYDALVAAGPDGVKSRAGYRDLVNGRWKVVDGAMNQLIKEGLVGKEQFGKAFWYRAIASIPPEPQDDEGAF